MPNLSRRFVGLCVPPLVLATVDAILTLCGQSAEYWTGNYGHVNEMSPTFHHLLSYHPLAFVAGFVIWLLLFSSLIMLLPQTLALATSFAVTLGHMWGSTSWLLHRFRFGYQVCNGFFLLTAVVLALAIRHGWGAEPPADAPIGQQLPLSIRWMIIVILFAAIVYLFLWPRIA